ncbi:transposase [Methylobacterium pseudosasicola]|uniref:transposase n=1 Tax=Methylobacterium pseudosasicola TaxID=582667 RepID=UPI001428937C
MAIIDAQSVLCIGVRGPRGYDGAKRLVGRKRMALVDAEGHILAMAVVPANVQDRDTLSALDDGKEQWPSLSLAILDGAFRPSAAGSGAISPACATASSRRNPIRRASSCWSGAGWSSAPLAGSATGAAGIRASRRQYTDRRTRGGLARTGPADRQARPS